MFTARLNVLREYLKTVGDRNTVPDVLGYVSHVDGHLFAVTYFYTDTLKDAAREVYDERRIIYNFAAQSFGWTPNDPTFSSISLMFDYERGFVAHADDGTVEIECGAATVFDGYQCAPKPVCELPDVALPLTEDRLNRLVFDRLSARQKPEVGDDAFHPTAYVKCDSERVPHIEECLNGESFNGANCVYEPTVTTNGQGLVTSMDTARINTYTRRAFRKLRYEDYPDVEVNIDDSRPNDATELAVPFDVTARWARHGLWNLVDNAEKFANRTRPEIHLMVPVNHTHPFDVSPCLEHGQGHTFVSKIIAPNQFFECLSGDNMFLHSCGSVMFENGRHVCDFERECEQFERGTGTMLNSIRNDNITFDTGKSECKDYKIVEVVECDTGDFVADKKFEHPLGVSFRVGLPRQVFDADDDSCVEYDVNKVNIDNDYFAVMLRDSGPSRSMVGRVSKILTQRLLNDSDRVSAFVTYSRDLGEVCLDPKNCVALDCDDIKSGIVADVLDNTRYNVCEEGVLIGEKFLARDEYVEEGQVNRLEGYDGQCRFEDGVDYFDIPYRTVDGYSCFFTVPTPL